MDKNNGIHFKVLIIILPLLLVHRENPRSMDVVMNGWLRLP